MRKIWYGAGISLIVLTVLEMILIGMNIEQPTKIGYILNDALVITVTLLLFEFEKKSKFFSK